MLCANHLLPKYVYSVQVLRDLLPYIIFCGPFPGVLQTAGPGLPPRPFPGQSPARAPMPAMGRDGFVPSQMVPPRSKAPVMEMKSVNQMAPNDQMSLQSNHQEALHTEKKVHFNICPSGMSCKPVSLYMSCF